MKRIHKTGMAILAVIILVTGIFWLDAGQAVREGTIIATAVPADTDLRKQETEPAPGYMARSKIIALDPDAQSVSEALELSQGFNSACSPEVSYAGDKLVFSGQKAEDDLWQIYISDLRNGKTTQVTEMAFHCTDPAWLPDGRIVFTGWITDENTGKQRALYASLPDGSEVERLTYLPVTYDKPSVLQDGRILTLAGHNDPDEGQAQLMALRTDGTKSELFFGCQDQITPAWKAWEAPDGKVYFIGHALDEPGQGHLVSVETGRPISSLVLYNHPSAKVDFHSVYPSVNGDLLVAYREDNQSLFELGVYDISDSKASGLFEGKNKVHLIEPVVVESRPVPMKLPATINTGVSKGTFLCMNADLSVNPVEEPGYGTRPTDKVQVFSTDGLLGEVTVEKDGSFYIEIDSDMPIRFRTLGENGEVLRGHSAWISVRPGERRSCVGCHADHSLAPENRVPDALYTGMVFLPEGKKTEPIVLNEKRAGK